MEARSESLYGAVELAREFAITPRAVRFYETKGLLSPRRVGARRVYDYRDRARLALILRGKRLGFSLSEIRDYLELYDADTSQAGQLRQLSSAVAGRIEDLERQREALDRTLEELTGIRDQAHAAMRARGIDPAPPGGACIPHSPKNRRRRPMNNVVIAGYARTPFHFARKGALARVRPDDLAATVVRALIERSGVKPEDIEDLIVGCAFPEGEQGFNVARIIGFLSDLPLSVAGTTVNRFCGSSMQAIHMAAGAIALDAGEAFICAGVESMTRVPMGGYNPLPNPDLYASFPAVYMGMGETAENVAQKYQIGREEQEAFAVRSHRLAARAQGEGRLAGEIVAVNAAAGPVGEDGCLRPDTSAEALADLKPAFLENGSVTAGTSSPLTDGASAVLVTTEAYAERNGLEPLARLRSVAVAGCAPDIMGIGPVHASRKALARAGIEAGDLDVVELNEAFASQAIASIRDLGLDAERVNIDGGAIALGHPLGATGARITGKAAAVLKREGGRYALASQCIGGGQGIATVLEAL
jgi:acetyl-CoA acyltransferase